MIALLQRVVESRVTVDAAIVASGGHGLLVLVGVRPEDTTGNADKLLDRILKYRVFADDHGKMNRNIVEIGGDLVLVPQFTLAADTHSGLRPSFASAAPPALAHALFEHLVTAARARHPRVGCGVFGAHMQVSLTNDGPVTFWLET